MSATANWLEVGWALMALVGFLVNAWAINDAVADLRYLEARGLNGARERVARGNARDETLRAVIQAIFLVIAVVALTTAPTDPDRPITPLGVVLTGGIIGVEIILIAKAFLGRRDRRWIVAYLNRQEGLGE